MHSIPNSSIINSDSALKRLNGNQDMLAALAGFFLEDAPQLLQQLHLGLASNALPQVARAAHSLRGLASTFDPSVVLECAAEVERASKASDTPRLPDMVKRLDAEVRQLIDALQQLTNR
jgi:two-component system, sensor histidine kinase and response regulator